MSAPEVTAEAPAAPVEAPAPATETLSAVVPEDVPAESTTALTATTTTTTEKPAEPEQPAEASSSASAPAPAPAAPAEDVPQPKKVEDMTEDEMKAKILQQVEFYFSESNLPYDKFLFTLSYKDNPSHWVPVGTIASFKRMRDFLALKGTEFISAALRPSTLLELDESGEKVRRKVPLEDLERTKPQDAFARSVYVKGFGEEHPGMQLELEEWFAQYGKFNVVRMRRDKEKDKTFKGSVFVEWADMITANKFLMLDPKPKWKGNDLLIMSKKAYCDMKVAEKGIDPSKDPLKRGFSRATSVASVADSEGGESTGSGPTRARREFSGWKLINESKKEEKQRQKSEKPDVMIDLEGEKIKVNKEGKVDPEAIEGKYKKGTVLVFENAPTNVPFGDVKDPLKSEFARVFVDYRRGAGKGILVIGAEEGKPLEPITDAQLETVKSKVPKVGENEVTWRRATDEEEKKYWLERANHIAERAVGRAFASGGGRGGRGGRGGGRQNGRGGGHGDRNRDRGGHKPSPLKNEASARPDSVPTIKSTLAAPAKKEDGDKMDVDPAAGGEKRKREADGEAEGGEAKKAKVEEAVAA